MASKRDPEQFRLSLWAIVLSGYAVASVLQMLTNREPRSSCKCIWLFDFPARDQMQIIQKKVFCEAQSFVSWEIQRQTLNKIVILLKWAAEHIQLIEKIEWARVKVDF